MSEESAIANNGQVLRIGSEFLKYVATALVAMCVYFANQIKSDVAANSKKLVEINSTLQKMQFLEKEVTRLRDSIKEIENRLRSVETRE